VASTARARATDKEAPGTVFTFAIGGKAPLPKFKTYQSAGLLEGVKYALWILSWRSGRRQRWNIKNLGWAPAEEIANLKDMVFKGPFTDQGMPDFTGKLSEDDVVKIQAFVQGTADVVRSQK
jgi:quinohemoprotein ethanol dehydrogenase